MTPGFFQITLKVFLIRRADEPEFLVLKDSESQLGDLPGGRLAEQEIEEPFRDSIAREMREELGRIEYELTEDPLFYFPHRIRNGGYPALGIAFLARYKSGNIELSEEHDSAEWVGVKSYRPEILFTEHLLSAVRRFQNSFDLAR